MAAPDATSPTPPDDATALIGYTGFVGSNLAKQACWSAEYHSRNIEEIAGREFRLLVVAGIQAKKWWANQNPAEDWAGIERLLTALRQVQAEQVVLISTIDVYSSPVGVDENTPAVPTEGNAYGLHRLRAEQEIQAHFPRTLTVRLPGLFGEGLKKNVIYDLQHDNGLELINPASVFQYYYLRRLWMDLQRCLGQGLTLVNFATEPLPTEELRQRFFPIKVVGGKAAPAAQYDFRTAHATTLGGTGVYLYDKATVLEDLAHYLQQPAA